MFQKISYIIVSFFLISCAGTQKGKPPFENGPSDSIFVNLEVHKETLPSGLRVLIVENHNLPIFSYYTFFDVGSRFEKDGQTGASHFLEHLMFKGAKKYGPGVFDTSIEKNGGSTNAYTTNDLTVYHENMPTSSLEMIMDMEADRMVNLSLDPVTFESERQVVLEERKLRYENSPQGKIYLTMMKKVFKNSPYEGSVIGEESDLRSLSRDHVQQYFKRYYSPNNAVIVIVGDVSAGKTMSLIRKKFGDLPPSGDLEKEKSPLEFDDLYKHKAKYPQEISLQGSSPDPIFIFAYKGIKSGIRESFVLDMLASILAEGESSYLNRLYVQNARPELSSVGASNYTLKKNGVFFIQGTLLKRTDLESFKRKYLKDSEKFCEDAIDERSLQKTKNQYYVSYYDELDSNGGVAQLIGLREIFYNDYKFYLKELEAYNSISLIELKHACNDIFKGNKSIFLNIWAGNKS
ncbi:MAG: M16 family metallopeptidase [Bacteriovoracales bacterium]